MYFACATVQDNQHHGSTKLHMDITDATNIMLYAANCRDGRPGYAVWHIFRAIDAFLLRKFIREYCGFIGPGDPIHSQTVYLTPDLLELLFRIYGIRPYTIYHYPNQVVYIPAYCAHQVSYDVNVQVPLLINHYRWRI
jgi:lysine-specific demethylase 3